MHSITQIVLQELLAGGEPPCVSLYLPTHRMFPDNKQDPIRFKNLARSAEESLRREYFSREVRPMLERFEALAGDGVFWNHTVDGLAVLADAKRFEVLQLLRPVPEAAIVADSFHVKPLLRYVQSADRYGVLCLTRESAKVFEGNRDHLDPVDLPDFAATAAAALGEERKQPSVTVRSPGIFHGHDSRKDLVDQDAEKFFRVVDRQVREKFSAVSKLPLVLAALAEHQPVFREISQNERLLAEGVHRDPQSLDADALRRAVWSALEPTYLRRLAGLLEDFSTAQAHQRGSADVSDVARAAAASRVALLLVDADRVVPGKLDRDTGAIQAAELADPAVGDLVDDVAEHVLRTGGEVVVVPSDRMPTDSGLAATYRY